MSKEQEWISWVDPADDKTKYFAVSSDTGIFWTEDTDNPLIVNVSELDVKDSIEDTIHQIAEKYKMGKGKQYERFNLFQHPNKKTHAYLAVEKLPDGGRDPETNKVTRSYQAYFTHKFKRVTCISRITGRPQGNPSMQDKEYARRSSAKAKQERKKKLANAAETAKKLRFDPLQRLALYAMGDKERLGLNEDVKQSIQMKALETFLKYSHQQMKPFSPQEIERLKGSDSGPRINIVLPSDGSENEQQVITHKDEKSLERYLERGGGDAYESIEGDLEVNDEGFKREYARIDLPDDPS